MKHANIDIETLGTGAGYVILSVGVDIMDIYINDGVLEAVDISTFSFKFSRQDQLDQAYKVDLGTQKWWNVQSEDARRVLVEKDDDLVLEDGLLHLHRQLSNYSPDWYWSKGAMDYNMLSYMYDQNEMQTPWKYWQLRDLRGLLDLAHWSRTDVVNNLPHNAMADARYQNHQLVHALELLYAVKPELVERYTGVF